jgi:fucose permease
MEKAVALSCVFGLGMCFTLLGAISVKLMPRLKIDHAGFGWLISTFMFSCLIAVLIIGVTIDKIGHKPVAIAGFLITGLCILAMAYGKSYKVALTACLFLGFGAMALNTVGNTLIPHVLFGGKNQTAALNLGNVSTCLGLFLSPMLVSFLFRKTSYEKAVAALAAIALAPVVLALTAQYPRIEAGFALSDAFGLLGNPATLLAGLVLFCYIALESSFCNWLPPYGNEVIATANPSLGADAVDASSQRLLSVFAIAMMIGRLLASAIPAIGTHGVWFIVGAAVVSGLIVLAMTVSKSAPLAWLLAALAGLVFAPVFPTTIGVTFPKFPDTVQGSLFGIIFAIGLLGAVIVPKAMGNLAKGASIQKSLKLLLPICAAMVILAWILNKV